jgi:dynactin complex subunit
MLVEHINFRITQRLLLKWPQLASVIPKLNPSLSLFRQQLSSVWSKNAIEDDKQSDIDHLLLLNRYNDGLALMGKLIFYLNDRFAFQERWLIAIEQLNNSIPIRFYWAGLLF